MKKLVLIVLSLTIFIGTLLVPVAASATTAEDCYNFFTTLPAAEYYKEDVKHLMDVVPCTDAQAEVVMEGLKKFETISKRYSGDASWLPNDPRGFSKADVAEVFGILDTICGTLNLTYEVVVGNVISDVDPIEVNFYYNGELVYVYDGDFIRTTGSDIPVWPAVAGVVLLAAAAVSVCLKKTKENV